MGLAAAPLSLTMTVPQALRVWRTKSYVGLAATMWILLVVTFGAWIGLAIRSDDKVLLAAI